MKLSFAFAFIILYKLPFAQIAVISESVIHPDSNILYIGVDNIIKVSGINNYKILSTNSEVNKIQKDKFNIRVSNFGESIIKLYKNRKLTFSKVFRIDVIHTPIPQLGTIVDSFSTVREILIDPSLQLVLRGSSYKHSFQIVRFDITIIRVNGDTISKGNVVGNLIPANQLNIIQRLGDGDHLYFSNIYGTCPDCRRFKFSPFKIQIKES